METVIFALLAIFLMVLIIEVILIMVDKDICHMIYRLDEIKRLLRRRDDQ